ncbi:MAG: M56 family metallopeptidase [Saprospiraceae bacterium]
MNLPGLPQYLLESSFCLLIFYGFYHVLLRRETFFQINRLYLIVTPILAILIPLLHIDLEAPVAPELRRGAMEEFIIPVISNAAQLNSDIASQIEQPSPLFSLTFGDAVILIYLLGALGMGLRLIVGLLRLFQTIRASKQSNEEAYTLIDMEGDFPAASFFSYIFWNGDKNDEKQRWILEHELVHFRQWHSLDVLAMELIVIIKWFNPLIYFFRKSLKATHEYIADSYVVAQLGSAPSYAKVLIHHSNRSTQNRLVNTFSALIKKRLIMLGQDQSQAWRKVKYFLSLPLLAVLMMLFSFNLVEQLPNKITTQLSEVNTYLEDLGAQDLIVVDRVAEKEQTLINWGNEEILLSSFEESTESLKLVAMKRANFEQKELEHFKLYQGGKVVVARSMEFRVVPEGADYFIKLTPESGALEELFQVTNAIEKNFNLMMRIGLPNGEDFFGILVVSETGVLNINSPTQAFSLPKKERVPALVTNEQNSVYYFDWGNIHFPFQSVKATQKGQDFAVSKAGTASFQKGFGHRKVDLASLQNSFQEICTIFNEEGVPLAMDSLSFQFKKNASSEETTFSWTAIKNLWKTPQAVADLFDNLAVGDQLIIRQWNRQEKLFFASTLEIVASPALKSSMVRFNIGALEVPLSLSGSITNNAVQKNISRERIKSILSGEFIFYKNNTRVPIKNLIFQLKKTGAETAETKLVELDEKQVLSNEEIEDLWAILTPGDYLTLSELHLDNQENYALSFRIATNDVKTTAFVQATNDYIRWGEIKTPVHAVNTLNQSTKFTVQSIAASVFTNSKDQSLSIYHQGVKQAIEKVYISVLNENETPLFCDGESDCFKDLLTKIKAESSIQLLIRTKAQQVFYAVFSISDAPKSVYRYNQQVSDFITQGIQALSYRVVSSIEPAVATFQEEPNLFEWGSIKVPFGKSSNNHVQENIVVDYDDLVKSISKDIKIWMGEDLMKSGLVSIVRFPNNLHDYPDEQKISLEPLTINLAQQGESQDQKINLLLDRVVKGDDVWVSATLDSFSFRLKIAVFDPKAAWRPEVNRTALLLDRSIYKFQFIHQEGQRTRIKMDTTDASYRWMYESYKDGKQLDIIHIPNFKTVKRVINEADEVVPRGEIDQVYQLDKSLEQPAELFPEFYDFKHNPIDLKWRGITGRLDNQRDALADFLASRDQGLELWVGDEKLEIVHFNMTILPKEGSNIKVIANDIHDATIEKLINELTPKTSIYFNRMLVKLTTGELVHFPLALVFNLE